MAACFFVLFLGSICAVRFFDGVLGILEYYPQITQRRISLLFSSARVGGHPSKFLSAKSVQSADVLCFRSNKFSVTCLQARAATFGLPLISQSLRIELDVRTITQVDEVITHARGDKPICLRASQTARHLFQF